MNDALINRTVVETEDNGETVTVTELWNTKHPDCPFVKFEQFYQSVEPLFIIPTKLINKEEAEELYPPVQL